LLGAVSESGQDFCFSMEKHLHHFPSADAPSDGIGATHA
jgi:hypothetical protein